MAKPAASLGARPAATGSREKGSYVKQRNGRKMALAGTTVFGGLVIGTVAAAAGGAPGTEDIAVSRLQVPSVVAPGASGVVAVALPTDPVAIAALVEAVGGHDGDGRGRGRRRSPSWCRMRRPPPHRPRRPPPWQPRRPAPAPEPVAVEAEPVVTEAARPGPGAHGGRSKRPSPPGSPTSTTRPSTSPAASPAMNPGAVSRGRRQPRPVPDQQRPPRRLRGRHRPPWEAASTTPYYNAQFARRLYDSSGWRPGPAARSPAGGPRLAGCPAMAGWTTADIPDQTGRTVLVTGANSGLGLRSAEALAGRRGPGRCSPAATPRRPPPPSSR